MKRVRIEKPAAPYLHVTITLVGHRRRGPVYDAVVDDGGLAIASVDRQRAPFCAAARATVALGKYSPLTPIKMFRRGASEPALVGSLGRVARLTVMENNTGIHLVPYHPRDVGSDEEDEHADE